MNLNMLKRISLFTVAFVAFTANAVTLDIEKFKAKGRAELEAIAGKGNLVGDAKIYYRDGAGSLDLEPMYDYGAFYYAMNLKKGILPSADLRLAFRLNLSGSLDTVMILNPEKFTDLAVALPAKGVATLEGKAEKAEIESLVAELRALAPEGNFELLSEIGILIYAVSIEHSAQVMQKLKASDLVATVELYLENYRLPFEFDTTISVSESGKIDADKFRGIVKRVKDAGMPFTTETTVPSELQ